MLPFSKGEVGFFLFDILIIGIVVGLACSYCCLKKKDKPVIVEAQQLTAAAPTDPNLEAEAPLQTEALPQTEAEINEADLEDEIESPET